MNHTMILASTAPGLGGSGFWRRISDSLALYGRRIRERDELARFTERELRDAGITTTDAWIEINKPFWRE